MMPFDLSATITNERQLMDVATHCVNEFWAEVAQQPQSSYPLIQLDGGDFPDQGYCGARLLSVQDTARNIVAKFYTKNILGQPKIVLKAALELELALLLLKQMPNSFRFNYQRTISPLIPVTGAAVHVIRQIVWGIEKTLQRHAATGLLIERQHAHLQTLFYFHQLQPSEKEGADYHKRQPHDWVHALYLSQKSSLFLPLNLLQDSALSSGLVSYWWDCHSFFSRSDRNLFERLAAVPTRRSTGVSKVPRENRYEDQVVAMFKLLPAIKPAAGAFSRQMS